MWRPADNLDRHRATDVIRTIDGDTFEARVHLSPGVDPVSRVRLRGIDAPELKASCPEELEKAEAASAAFARRGIVPEHLPNMHAWSARRPAARTRTAAAGSTAAIHSAGGRIQALGSRKLQFVVREPYVFGEQRCRLRGGLNVRLVE